MYTYDAWGKILSVTDGSGSAVSDASHIANVNPIRYRGYYYDVETGFYYLQSRYYDPEVGRFINADEGISASLSGANLFVYCENEPIRHSDPTGKVAVIDDLLILGTVILGSFLTICIFQTVSCNDLWPDGSSTLKIRDSNIYELPEPNRSPSLKLPPLISPVSGTKTETKPTRPSRNAQYYTAICLGVGVAVNYQKPMNIDEAVIHINNGKDIWTWYEEDALSLCILASGGYEGPERGAADGNCWNYHLKKRRGHVHSFYGMNGVDFYGPC